MKVSGKSAGIAATPGVTGSKPSGGAQRAGAAQPTTVQGDAFSVSSSAQLLAVAREQLARIPDIRTEKVQAIKAKMDSDDYNPDGEAVAEGLIREHTPPASVPDR